MATTTSAWSFLPTDPGLLTAWLGFGWLASVVANAAAGINRLPTKAPGKLMVTAMDRPTNGHTESK
jgi:hypothetical protein